MRLASICVALTLALGCGSSGSAPADSAVTGTLDGAQPAGDLGAPADAAGPEAPVPADALLDLGATPDAAADIATADTSMASADTAVAPADSAADLAADSAPDTSPDLAPPMPVTMQFTGTVATVAGTPLGLDSTARTAAITGTFTYDLRTPDARPADLKRGRYEHGTTSGFTFTVLGHTVEGSGYAVVEIEDLDPDTFRFRDGPGLDTIPRIMKVDGTAAPMLKLTIAIASGNNAFLTSDALPRPFPTIDITQTAHTFSLSDNGGTLLMQLTTLTPK
jgi:hypothetical protein